MNRLKTLWQNMLTSLILSTKQTLLKIFHFYLRLAWTWFLGVAFIRYTSNLRVSHESPFGRFRLWIRTCRFIPAAWRGTRLLAVAPGGLSAEFQHLGFPDLGGSTLHTYPFSWTGLTALHRLVVKSNYFLKWESIQKYYPNVAAQLNANLPFYLEADLIREECFVGGEILISAKVLQQLDHLLMQGFNSYLFEVVESDPYAVFHLFFDQHVQDAIILRFLSEHVPYLLSRYSTAAYLTQLRTVSTKSLEVDFGAYWFADFAWLSYGYQMVFEQIGIFLYRETFCGRLVGLGRLPFYSVWSKPAHVLLFSEVLLIGGPLVVAFWFFFYSLMDIGAHRYETYNALSQLPVEPDASQLPRFSKDFVRRFSVTTILRFIMRVVNIRFPDNFILYFSASRLRWRQEFIRKNPLKLGLIRDLDFAVSIVFLVFFVRGVDYFRLTYTKRDFLRVFKKFRKSANRRYISRHQQVVSPVVVLAEAAEGRVYRKGFLPLRKSDDFPLVWVSRLARQYWVPYRARKRLYTTRRTELLLTRYLGHMARKRFRRRRLRLSRFYKKLRRRSIHSYSSRFQTLRKSRHRRRAVLLTGQASAVKKTPLWFSLRPRLYGGYLRAGTDQRFDIFTLIDPAETFLLSENLRVNDQGLFLPFVYQWHFDQQSLGEDCCDFLLRGSFGDLSKTLVQEAKDLIAESGVATWLGFTTADTVFRPLNRLGLLERGGVGGAPQYLLGGSSLWVNIYARQRLLTEHVLHRVAQQRWLLSNELVNTLALNRITQDRDRHLQQLTPLGLSRFTRYFAFYSKQLRYSLGFGAVQFPFLLGERLGTFGRSVGQLRRGGTFVHVVKTYSDTSAFKLFLQVPLRRIPRSRRFRYNGQGANLPLDGPDRVLLQKARDFSLSGITGQARSWQRLLRHKKVWRHTAALAQTRNTFFMDETQRVRQKGAMYSFLVPEASAVSAVSWRSTRRARALRRLLFTPATPHLSEFAQRSVEQKLFRLLLIRRTRPWRRMFRKYALFTTPLTQGDLQASTDTSLRARGNRLFFYPWRQDRVKGRLAGAPQVLTALTRGLRRMGFGTLARLSLRNEKPRQIVIETMGRHVRSQVKRWKRRYRHRGRGLLQQAKLKKIAAYNRSRFQEQAQYKRVFAFNLANRRRFRWRRSVRRSQIAVRRRRRPYRVWYRFEGKTKRVSSVFAKQLQARHPIRQALERKKHVGSDYESDMPLILTNEYRWSQKLKAASLFRSPLVDSLTLRQARAKALLSFSPRHSFQFLVLRRKLKLLHSLPFFRTNRHVLRGWVSKSLPFLARQTQVGRILLQDLHQKLRLAAPRLSIPASRLLTDFKYAVARRQHTRVGATAERRILNYYCHRFAIPSASGSLKGNGSRGFQKSQQTTRPWGALYYSFGQSRGSQYFKIFSPVILFQNSCPVLWNELTLSQRFSLRSYFADVAQVVGDRPQPRRLDLGTEATLVSLKAPSQDLYMSRTLFSRVLVWLKRTRMSALSPYDSAHFGQSYDDRLWHAFPYRLSKDHMRRFPRRVAKRRYIIVEFMRKDWYEVYNDYCQDWELFQTTTQGRQPDIIDTSFLVQTRGYDPHFKLIKRAEVSDLAVLAETFAYQFRVASLFPLFTAPWRSFFRQQTRVRMLPLVSSSQNRLFQVRTYRQNWFARLRRRFKIFPLWYQFSKLRTLRSFVSPFQVRNVAPRYARRSLAEFRFRKALRSTRKMTLFRGGVLAYPFLELWKIRRRRTSRFLLHVRQTRAQRRFGLFTKAPYVRGERLERRVDDKPHFRFRYTRKDGGRLGLRKRRRTKRVLRPYFRRRAQYQPLTQNRRHRFFNYRSTRKRAPVLFRSSLFSKTKYLGSLQQDVLGPQILQTVRTQKLARLYIPSTFLAKKQKRKMRYYRKRFFRWASYKPRFRKFRNRLRRDVRTHRMRWLRNRAIRYLRRAHLNPLFDDLRSQSFFQRFVGRIRPHQFKIVPLERLPQVNRRSTVLTVHNFSEYTTPKWRDLFGVMDSFIYYDYRYAKGGVSAAATIDAVSDQSNWLRRNNFKIDEDLLATTGTVTQEFESRVFSHQIMRHRFWDLVPFTIDPKVHAQRPRFTWLQRALSRSLGARVFRRKSSVRRRNRNRLLWLVFYEQFVSNAVVKKNFGRFLRWHRFARQLHIVWRQQRRGSRVRGGRYKYRRQFFLLRHLRQPRFYFRGERKRVDVPRNRQRLRHERDRWRLFLGTRRGVRNRQVLTVGSTTAVAGSPARLKLAKMRYGFWSQWRKFQNTVRLGDCLNLVTFRFYHGRQPVGNLTQFSLKFQLAINLFEYRKFRNRVTGKSRRRPRSVFLGRGSWKTRPIWFNADSVLFDSPLSRGERLGRLYRRIGGARRAIRKQRNRRNTVNLFRRSSWLLNLVRGHREVYVSYLHRFSTRVGLHSRRQPDFPRKHRFMRRSGIKPRQRVRHVFEGVGLGDLITTQRRAALQDVTLDITAPFWVLKNRGKGARLDFRLRRRRRLRKIRTGHYKRSRRDYYLYRQYLFERLSGVRLRPAFSKSNVRRGFRSYPAVRHGRRRAHGARVLYPFRQLVRSVGPRLRRRYPLPKDVNYWQYALPSISPRSWRGMLKGILFRQRLSRAGRVRVPNGNAERRLLVRSRKRFRQVWTRTLYNRSRRHRNLDYVSRRTVAPRRYYNDRRQRYQVMQSRAFFRRYLYRLLPAWKIPATYRDSLFLPPSGTSRFSRRTAYSRTLAVLRYILRFPQVITMIKTPVTTWQAVHRRKVSTRRRLAAAQRRRVLFSVGRQVFSQQRRGLSWHQRRGFGFRYTRWRVKRLLPQLWALHKERAATMDRRPNEDIDVFFTRLSTMMYNRWGLYSFTRFPKALLYRYRSYTSRRYRFVRKLRARFWSRSEKLNRLYRWQIFSHYFEIREKERKRKEALAQQQLAQAQHAQHRFLTTREVTFDAMGFPRFITPRFVASVNTRIAQKTRDRTRAQQAYQRKLVKQQPRFYRPWGDSDDDSSDDNEYISLQPHPPNSRFYRDQKLIDDFTDPDVFVRYSLRARGRLPMIIRYALRQERLLRRAFFIHNGRAHRLQERGFFYGRATDALRNRFLRRRQYKRRLRRWEPQAQAREEGWDLHFSRASYEQLSGTEFLFRLWNPMGRKSLLGGSRFFLGPRVKRGVRGIRLFAQERIGLYRPTLRRFLKQTTSWPAVLWARRKRFRHLKALSQVGLGSREGLPPRVRAVFKRKIKRRHLGYKHTYWPRLRRRARRAQTWQRIWSVARNYAAGNRVLLFRQKYRSFRKRLKRRMRISYFRQRHRKRFILFYRGGARRSILFQTRHQTRNFDWITRRVSPRYLQSVAYLKGFENVTVPRFNSNTPRAANLSPLAVTTGLDSLRSSDLLTNYRTSSIGGSFLDWMEVYTPRQRRILAAAQSAQGVPFGWAFALRRGDVVTSTFTSTRWQAFTDLFGGVQGRSSQVLLWLLSGYAAGKSLVSKELFVAQFITQTLGLVTGTPAFDVSYVLSYWVSAWWDAFSATFRTSQAPLVLPMDYGLEEPYLLQQVIRRYEFEADRDLWADRLGQGLRKLTKVTAAGDVQGHFIFSSFSKPSLENTINAFLLTGASKPGGYAENWPFIIHHYFVAPPRKFGSASTSVAYTKEAARALGLSSSGIALQLQMIPPRFLQARNPIDGDDGLIIKSLVVLPEFVPIPATNVPFVAKSLVPPGFPDSLIVRRAGRPLVLRADDVLPTVKKVTRRNSRFSAAVATKALALSPEIDLSDEEDALPRRRIILTKYKYHDPLVRPMDIELRNDWYFKMLAHEPNKNPPPPGIKRYVMARWAGASLADLRRPAFDEPLIWNDRFFDPGAAFGYGVVDFDREHKPILSPMLPTFFSPQRGEDYFMENSNIHYFKINGLVSYDENQLRLRGNLSPRPVHEELRDLVFEQQEREQRYARMMQQAVFDIRDTFLRAGVRLAYLPEPLATDNELVDFALARNVPLEVKFRPFLDRLHAALWAQDHRILPARPRRDARFVDGVPGGVFERRAKPMGTPTVVYPSGVNGSRGLLIRILSDSEILTRGAMHLEREVLNKGCSLAVWEYVWQYLKRSEVVLPDWAFSDHPGYLGHPPHSLRIPILDLDSEEFLMKASPIFDRWSIAFIRVPDLTARALYLRSPAQTYGFFFLDDTIFWLPRKRQR